MGHRDIGSFKGMVEDIEQAGSQKAGANMEEDLLKKSLLHANDYKSLRLAVTKNPIVLFASHKCRESGW